MSTTGKTALILFGHGSRDARWAEPINQVAQRVRELRPDAVVSCAYLELTAPDLPGAATQAIAAGASRIEVLPMFLGVGRHAREDLPELVATLQAAHPATHFVLRTALGEDPAMVEAIARWALGESQG
ncbi:MAG: CbiX/SirB N-terminal domain-containing protein [Comamonas sp.]